MATSKHTQLPLPLPDETFQIPLTQGQFAIVSAVDADLAQFKWCAQFDGKYANGGAYKARRYSYAIPNNRQLFYLHRVILSRMLGRELTSKELVDHKDLNPLNNCRSNLRLANNLQNGANARAYSTNTSGYKGVSWSKVMKKWAAAIRIDGRTRYIGYYLTPEEAHQAYCEKAKELHGEFARFE